MHHLFVYGTLMCDDIMAAVAGPCRRMGGARLAGYRRHALKGERFPGIVEAPGHGVAGVLYGGLGRRQLACLDRFEGPMYRRAVVRLALPGGGHRNAFTYVVRDAFRHLLEPHDWDLDGFERDGKRAFVRRHVGPGRT